MGRKGKFSRRKEKMEEKERIKKEEEEERIKKEKEQEETAIEASYPIEDSQYRLTWLRSQEAIDISYDDIKILHSVGIHSLNQLTAKDLNEEFAVKIFKAFDATLLILKALAEYYVVIVITTLEAAVEENPLTKWAFAIMSSSLKEFQAPEDILSRLEEVGNTSLVERCSKILHTPEQFELYESYVRLVRDQEKLKEEQQREIEEQEVEESEEEEALHRPEVEQSAMKKNSRMRSRERIQKESIKKEHERIEVEGEFCVDMLRNVNFVDPEDIKNLENRGILTLTGLITTKVALEPEFKKKMLLAVEGLVPFLKAKSEEFVKSSTLGDKDSKAYKVCKAYSRLVKVLNEKEKEEQLTHRPEGSTQNMALQSPMFKST